MSLAAIGAIAGPAVGSIVGQYMANEANKSMQRRAQDFSERMANTGHVREVADLRAAGLNPILSANSGASAPQGLTGAPQEDIIGKAANSAMEASKLSADLENVRADTNLKEDQGRAAIASAQKDASSAKQAATQTAILQKQYPAVKAESEAKTNLFNKVNEGANTINRATEFFTSPGSKVQTSPPPTNYNNPRNTSWENRRD